MLRRATESDRPALLRYLRAEPEFNLFFIGDIVQFGLEGERVEVFVDGDGPSPRAVLLKYLNSLVAWTHDPAADLSAIAEHANGFLDRGGQWMFSGKTEIIQRIQPFIRRRPESDITDVFSVCRTPCPADAVPQAGLAAYARPDDAAEISGLLRSIPQFAGGFAEGSLKQEIANGQRAVTVIRDPDSGRIASTATSVAETDTAAMIIAVATLDAFRARGYAAACTWRLAHDLHARGKSACLFFHAPVAGRIYHRLGFQDIGRWSLVKFR